MSGHPIRITDVTFSFDVQHPQAEFAFGKAVAGALTFAHTRVRVEDSAGRSANGWGAILLSYPWAFPSDSLDEETRDLIMRDILERAGAHVLTQQPGHPIDHFLSLENELSTIESQVSENLADGQAIPRMTTLVSICSLDAAIHDAYGRLLNRSSFDTLSAEHTGWQLGDILGAGYRDVRLDECLRSTPVETLPIYHTVGASDAMVASPDKPSLKKWIEDDGVFAYKVKLKGQDAQWDRQRLLDVYRLGISIHGDRVQLFADLNEQAPSLEYIENLLATVAKEEPGIIAALDAIEQPDRRDMDAAAMDFTSLEPAVTIALDEGLVSLSAVDRAHALGYRGLCLKTCKTQSLMLLTRAVASTQGMSVTVQDLTNPGIALHQSLGFASRLREIAPVETNQRQFYPHASGPEVAIWPRLYAVNNGLASVRDITGPGFGFDPNLIQRPIFQD